MSSLDLVRLSIYLSIDLSLICSTLQINIGRLKTQASMRVESLGMGNEKWRQILRWKVSQLQVRACSCKWELLSKWWLISLRANCNRQASEYFLSSPLSFSSLFTLCVDWHFSTVVSMNTLLIGIVVISYKSKRALIVWSFLAKKCFSWRLEIETGASLQIARRLFINWWASSMKEQRWSKGPLINRWTNKETTRRNFC